MRSIRLLFFTFILEGIEVNKIVMGSVGDSFIVFSFVSELLRVAEREKSTL